MKKGPKMGTEKTDVEISNDTVVVYGSGSVAHQIIGEFLSVLRNHEGCMEIADNLKTAIFEGRATEAGLRKAMFGEEPL
jgi:hypothetical protein